MSQKELQADVSKCKIDSTVDDQKIYFSQV